MDQPKILIDLPMEVLMWRVPTFCHPFFINDTKKLMAVTMFCLMFSSDCSTLATDVPKHEAFFDWNLTVCFISAILSSAFSPSAIAMGNLPIFTNTFPNNFVTPLAIESEAIKTSNFFAHFLIFPLSLLNALSPSTSM